MRKYLKYFGFGFIAFIFLLGLYRIIYPIAFEVTHPESSNGIALEYDCKPGETVLETLERNSQELETKDFSFGTQVVAIDGRVQTDDMYWLYTIDGKEATVSADAYVCQDKVRIRWELR